MHARLHSSCDLRRGHRAPEELINPYSILTSLAAYVSRRFPPARQGSSFDSLSKSLRRIFILRNRDYNARRPRIFFEQQTKTVRLDELEKVEPLPMQNLQVKFWNRVRICRICVISSAACDFSWSSQFLRQIRVRQTESRYEIAMGRSKLYASK